MTTVYDFFTQGCMMWKLCALIPYKKKTGSNLIFLHIEKQSLCVFGKFSSTYFYLKNFCVLRFLMERLACKEVYWGQKDCTMGPNIFWTLIPNFDDPNLSLDFSIFHSFMFSKAAFSWKICENRIDCELLNCNLNCGFINSLTTLLST